MANNTQFGAVARRAKLVDLPDGRHFELKALLITDWAQIQEEAAHYARRDLVETYARNADLLPAEQRLAVIQDAFKRAEEITADTISDSKVMAWTHTIRGQLFSVWLSMRGANALLTYDEAQALLSDYLEMLPGLSDTVAVLSRPSLWRKKKAPDSYSQTGTVQTAAANLEQATVAASQTSTTGRASRGGFLWTAWAALRRWMSGK